MAGEITYRSITQIRKEVETKRKRESYEKIEKNLEVKLREFISFFNENNEFRDEPWNERDFAYLEKTVIEIFQDLNEREVELESPEIKKAIEICNAIFTDPLFGVLCVDGRFFGSVIAGMISGGEGGLLRLPAGNLREAKQKRGSKKLSFSKRSVFARQLRALYRQKNEVTQILFTHLHCAAAGIADNEKRKKRKDSGLYRNVERNEKVKNAMLDLVQREYGEEKQLTVEQVCVDPRDQSLSFGLQYLLQEQRKRPDLSEKDIENFINEGSVISTRSFVTEFESDFKKYLFTIDFAKNHSQSMLQLWQGLHSMISKTNILSTIRERFVLLGKKHAQATLSEKSLEQLSKLFLVNAYSVYLHNKAGIKFDTHVENYIAVVEGMGGPYEKNTAFSVSTLRRELIPEDVMLTAGIIEKNRQERRIQHHKRTYYNKEEFESAPIVTTVAKIVRSELLDLDSWRILSGLDWKPLHSTWEHSSDQELLDVIARIIGKKISYERGQTIAKEILLLREKIKSLYGYDRSSEAMNDGRLFVVPMLSSSGRGPKVILPFVKFGEEEN